MTNNCTEAASTLEFFKVFLPDSGSLHLSMPPAFVKQLNATFPKKATINDDFGKSWRVTLEKLDDLVYLKNGWHDFVDYHSLKYGDFLIFQYDGHFTFDVKIFGKNGCKKAAAAEAPSSVPILDAVVVEAGNSVPILESVVADAGNSFPILKVKEEPVVENEDVEPLISRKRKRLQVGSVLKARNIAASNCGIPRNASKSIEQDSPRGPCFERTMKRWSNKTIYISGRVVRDQNISLKPNVVLRDEEGKSWPATVCCTSQNRISLTSGWSKFYKAHNLRINDQCDFEFVLERRNVCRQLNVRVIRRPLASPALKNA